jgi:hypothetical protein
LVLVLRCCCSNTNCFIIACCNWQTHDNQFSSFTVSITSIYYHILTREQENQFIALQRQQTTQLQQSIRCIVFFIHAFKKSLDQS